MTMPATNLPVGGTEQSELVTVAINGVTLGTFDTWSGGDVSAAVPQHRAGGQLNQQSYRALPKNTNITVSRVLNLAVDWEIVRTLISQVGTVTGSVTVQPLDINRVAYGNSRTSTGMFAACKDIKGDSTSDALQMYSLEFTSDQWQ